MQHNVLLIMTINAGDAYCTRLKSDRREIDVIPYYLTNPQMLTNYITDYDYRRCIVNRCVTHLVT